MPCDYNILQAYMCASVVDVTHAGWLLGEHNVWVTSHMQVNSCRLMCCLQSALSTHTPVALTLESLTQPSYDSI
jgi:hypothetical protein